MCKFLFVVIKERFETRVNKIKDIQEVCKTVFQDSFTRVSDNGRIFCIVQLENFPRFLTPVILELPAKKPFVRAIDVQIHLASEVFASNDSVFCQCIPKPNYSTLCPKNIGKSEILDIDCDFPPILWELFLVQLSSYITHHREASYCLLYCNSYWSILLYSEN